MYRTIRVNTDDLFDAALRFERLAFVLEDIAAEISTVRANMEDVDAFATDLADRIGRKANDLVFRMQGASAVLKFASGRYKDTKQRMDNVFTHSGEED